MGHNAKAQPRAVVTRILALGIGLALPAIGPGTGTAQSLPLRTVLPGEDSRSCPAWDAPSPPSDADSARIRLLEGEATEAIVRDDFDRAADALSRAVAIDPASPELNHLLGRIQDVRGATHLSRQHYCRLVVTEGSDARALDAARRLDARAARERAMLPDGARLAYARGVDAATDGRPDEAVELLRTALVRAPGYSDAQYNLGVTLVQLGRVREAGDAFDAYLRGAPDAPDAEAVARTLRGLESGVTASAGRRPEVLALGLVVPGMGQAYSGRPWGGVLTFSLAGGAIATGLLSERVRVRCAGDPRGGVCPPGRRLAAERERHLLRPALVTAGAIAVIAAVEAFVRSGPPDDHSTGTSVGITRGSESPAGGTAVAGTGAFRIRTPVIAAGRGGAVDIIFGRVALR